MSKRTARPGTLRRTEIVFEPDGRTHASFLWKELKELGGPAVSPPSPSPSAGAVPPDVPYVFRRLLASCDVCPQDCQVDRLVGELGTCRAGAGLRISRWGPEFGEESFLVGPGGSGVIFFSRCHMSCVFCHNFEATQGGEGVDYEVEDLARIMLELAEDRCSNIHLISPTHYGPQIADTLKAVREAGLSLPVVYNCSGYESVEMLQRLEGLVDIYLPDFKFGPGDEGAELAGAPHYFETAIEAISEMQRQVGPLVIGGDGLATRGLVVRHLVMPGPHRSSESILRALRDCVGAGVTLHLMSSYHPAFRSFERAELSKGTSQTEYDRAVGFARKLGFEKLIVDNG